MLPVCTQCAPLEHRDIWGTGIAIDRPSRSSSTTVSSISRFDCDDIHANLVQEEQWDRGFAAISLFGGDPNKFNDGGVHSGTELANKCSSSFIPEAPYVPITTWPSSNELSWLSSTPSRVLGSLHGDCTTFYANNICYGWRRWVHCQQTESCCGCRVGAPITNTTVPYSHNYRSLPEIEVILSLYNSNKATIGQTWEKECRCKANCRFVFQTRFVIILTWDIRFSSILLLLPSPILTSFVIDVTESAVCHVRCLVESTEDQQNPHGDGHVWRDLISSIQTVIWWRSE